VSVLTRFLQQPGLKHWQAAKRVLRYLKGTKTRTLTFGASEQSQDTAAAAVSTASALTPSSTIQVYCDADWAGDVDDRRSTTGAVIFLSGCAVIWLSKKQATVALSTAEAEYMAMSAALQEAKWLQRLVEEIGWPAATPMEFFSDNQAAISISSNPAVPHARTKHIDLRHHYVRECVQAGRISVQWVSSSKQMADVFTKGLNRQTFQELTEAIMKEEDNNKK
jgi:ribonuclease HI